MKNFHKLHKTNIFYKKYLFIFVSLLIILTPIFFIEKYYIISYKKSEIRELNYTNSDHIKWKNVKIKEIQTFNSLLSSTFPCFDVFLTFTNECKPILIILHNSYLSITEHDNQQMKALFNHWVKQLPNDDT